MRLLLISNSTNAGEEYLKYPIGDIAEFLSCANEVLFIPYAAVTFSYDEYAAKVQRRFDEIDIRVRSIHREADPVRAVMEAGSGRRGRRQYVRPDKEDAGATSSRTAS